MTDSVTTAARAAETGSAAPATTPTPAAASPPAPEAGAPKKKKEKKVPEGLGNFPKKPKLTKAERRALQEKQRAAKQGAKQAQGGGENNATGSSVASATPDAVQSRVAFDDPKRVKKNKKQEIVHRTFTQKQVGLFAHLPQYERATSLSRNVSVSGDAGPHNHALIHPAVLALGLTIGEHNVRGGVARSVGILTAFKRVFMDYTTPPNKNISRDLDRHIRPQISFLIECRTHSLAMGNVIKFLRHEILNLRADITEAEAKEYLCECIDDFIKSNVLNAQNNIVKHGLEKIVDGDVIMTYSRSSVVEQLLIAAFEAGRKFKVVVVASRPGHEGEDLVTRLAQKGLNCVFVVLPSVSYAMRQVTKVIIGASACLSNGTVLSRAGSAVVACVAHASSCPVLVCAETFKFCERVQLDSICYNELGDPDDLILSSTRDGDTTTRDTLSDWRDIPCMKLLNLVYDVTPMQFVSGIITELGLIPPTSVPVIVRERAMMNQGY